MFTFIYKSYMDFGNENINLVDMESNNPQLYNNLLADLNNIIQHFKIIDSSQLCKVMMNFFYDDDQVHKGYLGIRNNTKCTLPNKNILQVTICETSEYKKNAYTQEYIFLSPKLKAVNLASDVLLVLLDQHIVDMNVIDYCSECEHFCGTHFDCSIDTMKDIFNQIAIIFNKCTIKDIIDTFQLDEYKLEDVDSFIHQIIKLFEGKLIWCHENYIYNIDDGYNFEDIQIEI
jgi:hypothetical protein